MVRIVAAAAWPEVVGNIVTVTSQRKFVEEGLFYELSDGALGEEECLAPVYDGDQPASWEDCAWKPGKVKS